MARRVVFGLVLLLVIFAPGIFLSADEGMWTLNNLPLKQLQDKYGFVPFAPWVEAVQKSSARLPNCSSSFVSGDGLIMTNGHCAEEAVQALSTPANNLYEKGFYASTYDRELKTNLDLKVLVGVADVTSRVTDYVSKFNYDSEARQRIINNIQSEGSKLLALKCEVIVLYQGGRYDLYCYKTYNDIRLVFSSEKNVWFFGGDADNFEYPRYAMDVAFLRAYENGKPAKTPFHFKWSKSGAKEGELIFVSGHPGRTARLLTSKALKTERDVKVPFMLDVFRRRELTLQQFMLRGKEETRIAQADLFSWQNSRKLYVGKIRGLQDPKLMAAKIDSENKFFKDTYKNAALAGKYADGMLMIGDAQEVIRRNYAEYMLLARGLGFDSELFGYARSLVSGNQAYASSVLEAREKQPPLNLEYEEAKLRDSLTHLIEVFGPDDPMIAEMLKTYGGPAYMAHTLVYYSAVSNFNEHKKLVENGLENITKLPDPLIRLALFIEPSAGRYVKAINGALEQERRGYTLLSGALFKVYGADNYPDATFTLRLSFGRMSGYESDGKRVASATTIGGAYEHSAVFGNKGDYKLPARWRQRKNFINLETPLNFTSDLDITGGNSGSPVFNGKLEIVGIVFDSNIEGLVSDYDYNYAPNARAVAVHSAGIIELLKKVYRADKLAAELVR